MALRVYEGKDIRNIGVAGHGGSGKTSLVSALLYTAGATKTLGSVADGSTVTDYDEEEIARKVTISTGVAYCEAGNPSGGGRVKLNLLDTPGYNIFLNDTHASLDAVDSVLVVVDAVAGVEVQTEKVWSFAEEFEQARAIVINKLDRERAGFDRAVTSIQNAFGRNAIPIHMPLGEEKNHRGIIDLIAMKAYSYEAEGNGRGKEEAIPANLADAAQAAHEKLVEAAAEGDDKLLEEFFEHGTLPVEHIILGLKEAVLHKRIFPILCASGLHNIGSDQMLNFLAEYMPSPIARGACPGAATAGGEATLTRKISDSEPLSLFVYKTVADPFAGRLTYFKVMSGVLKSEATVTNYNKSEPERMSHVSVLMGKEMVPVTELHAGDLGVVAKLKDTLTGHSLGNEKSVIFYPPVILPEPLIKFAIEAKSRTDEDRMGVALHKILEEDTSLRFERDPQTKEFLLGGSGQQHVEVIVSKLKKRYHVDVTLKAPTIPYRETIRGRADVEGKHKKQTGGHGQFGLCRIKMEPMPRGAGFEFVNDIFGGSIPKNFIPAVEKGIIDSAARGYLAGFPVVDFRVSVYDGKYHDVDSSEMAFKIAGSLAFKAAMAEAKPVLLEPVMRVEVYAPDTFSGDLMGDLNSRRGRVQGMDNKGTTTVIKAMVPLSEMLTYATDLTSKTQGRASYHMEFDHYDTVPPLIADKVIEKAKAAKAAGGHVEEEEG